MSSVTQVLAWINEIRGEPVAALLVHCEEDELNAYCNSLERSATLKGETLPEMPSPAAAAERLGLEPPEDGEGEAPKSEAPKSEAPKSEAPKSEAPKSEAPKSEALDSKPRAEKPGAVKQQTRSPDDRMTTEQLAEMARRRAAAGDGNAVQASTPAGSEKERRGMALGRVAKLMKSAAEQLRQAPIEQLETFAENLAESFKTLTAGGASNPNPVSTASGPGCPADAQRSPQPGDESRQAAPKQPSRSDHPRDR